MNSTVTFITLQCALFAYNPIDVKRVVHIWGTKMRMDDLFPNIPIVKMNLLFKALRINMLLRRRRWIQVCHHTLNFALNADALLLVTDTLI